MAQSQPKAEQTTDETRTRPTEGREGLGAVARVLMAVRDFIVADFRRGAGILSVLGLALAALLALFVQYRVESIAPKAQLLPVNEPSAITGVSWSDDSKFVTVVSHRMVPTDVDGVRVEALDPQGIQRRFSEDGNLPPAMRALGGMPSDDGEFYIRLQRVGPSKDPSPGTDILTPADLFAIDGNGYPVVTGAASFQDANAPVRRATAVTGQDPGEVWQVGREEGSGNLRRVRIGGSGQQITAFAFMPRADLVAVGAIDGVVRLIKTLPPSLMSGRDPPADDIAGASLRADFHAHSSAVLSLAAARDPDRAALGGADLASIAMYRSIKVWRLASDEGLPDQRDVSFAGASPELIYAPGGLELSPLGETLLLRTPAGVIFAARISDGSWPPDANRSRAQESVSTPTQTSPAGQTRPLLLREVILPVRTTAATLSKDGRSLFAAGSDCIIREVDLRPVFASSAPANTASIVAEFGGHGGVITHLALSPNGAFLAIASLDQRVRIHRLDRARTISTILLSDLPTGPPCASTPAIEVARPDYADQSQNQNQNQNQNQKVTVYFAGSINRQDMITFTQGIRDLGWNVQNADRGGERTPRAAGLDIIRYGANEDRSAAERLSQQVSRTSPARRSVAVEQSGSVAPGTLEIWISN